MKVKTKKAKVFYPPNPNGKHLTGNILIEYIRSFNRINNLRSCHHIINGKEVHV